MPNPNYNPPVNTPPFPANPPRTPPYPTTMGNPIQQNPLQPTPLYRPPAPLQGGFGNPGAPPTLMGTYPTAPNPYSGPYVAAPKNPSQPEIPPWVLPPENYSTLTPPTHYPGAPSPSYPDMS